MTEYPPPPDDRYPPFELALEEVAAATLLNFKMSICMNCQQPVFYYPADKAYVKGHIYSESGTAEFRISNCCEFCFDKMFKEPTEEEINAYEGGLDETADGVTDARSFDPGDYDF